MSIRPASGCRWTLVHCGAREGIEQRDQPCHPPWLPNPLTPHPAACGNPKALAFGDVKMLGGCRSNPRGQEGPSPIILLLPRSTGIQRTPG